MGLFDFLKPKEPKREPLDRNKVYREFAFPEGISQFNTELDELLELVSGKLAEDEAAQLLFREKVQLLTTVNFSKDHIVDSIIRETSGKLTRELASKASDYISSQVYKMIFRGGDGDSEEKAVQICCLDTPTTVKAEYFWLEMKFGKRGVDWELLTKDSLWEKGSKFFESFQIKLADGINKKLFFDISVGITTQAKFMLDKQG